MKEIVVIRYVPERYDKNLYESWWAGYWEATYMVEGYIVCSSREPTADKARAFGIRASKTFKDKA